MLFIGLLSISVVFVINNAITAYQRGVVLTRVDSTGNYLVDDIRNSIQNATSQTDLGKNISITKTGDIIIDGVKEENIPLYGAFCTGDYTYVWNSGYFFSDDVAFADPEQTTRYAKIKYGDIIINSDEPSKLIKIKDQNRSICKSALITEDGVTSVDDNPLNNVFTLTLSEDEESIGIINSIEVLPNDANNDLAIYDLSVTIPAVNASENLSLYAVSFILGTTTGGVNIITSNDSCSTPVGDTNYNNNCAINKFSFVAKSEAESVDQTEIEVDPTPPSSPPTPVIPPHKITYQPNCTTAQLLPQTFTFTTTAIVRDNSFICPYHNFTNWNTLANNQGLPYQKDDAITSEDNIILYAQWQRRNANITYRPNGGKPTNNISHTPTPQEGTDVTLYNNKTFTRDYFTLSNWRESVTKQNYQPSSSYLVKGDTIFDAMWTRDIYKINYVRGCGSTDTAHDEVYAGNNYTIKNNLTAQAGKQWTCPNSDFKGWSATKNGTADSNYAPDTVIKPTKAGTLTLYAVWTTKTYTCTKQYRLQNADGTYPTAYTVDRVDTIIYGNTCSYTKTVQDYNNNAALSATATNVTGDVTLSLDFPRNIYQLNVVAGANTSNPTGSGTYRWGQITSVGVTKATDVTCTNYGAPSWIVSSGTTGTFDSTSGTSVNYTMGKGNSTVTASSSSTAKQQTITFKTVNANNINFNGTTKTNNQTMNVNCGTYNISGTFPTNYQFSSWSANAGSLSDSYALNSTYTVNGPATLTLTGARTKYNVQYIRKCGSSDTTSNVYQVYAGDSHTVISNPWTCSGYTFNGWSPNYAPGSNITVNNNITIQATWKANTPPSPPAASCPSGFTEWTAGLCWRNYDQSGYFNNSEAKKSCSNNGWRLPTSSEYANLIKKYCVGAWDNGTAYCTATSITNKGFSFNGSKLISTTGQGTYGFYWSSNGSTIMSIINDSGAGKTSATIQNGKVQGIDANNSLVRISARCVVNKN